ncbi:MAG: PmoA family protein [Bacteroidota bacterium]
MNNSKTIVLILSFISPFMLISQNVGVTFNTLPNKDIEVKINGKLFTQYFISQNEEVKKPVLYPLITENGQLLTRGYPVAPRAGERIDHPHHVGLWLNYGKVNGIDYWNNSREILTTGDPKNYGLVKHQAVTKIKPGKDKGELSIRAGWFEADGKGKEVLEENTTFIFGTHPLGRYIDRITTLKALVESVYFKDDKEGMIAIRVARELEHPSNKPEIFTDAQGKETNVPTLDNTGVTGEYLSSEGIKGEEVWSTRAKWMRLGGMIKDKPVSITILDHPKNKSYPTYWHERGYGLFSANPLGANIFSKGKDSLNLTLKKGEEVTFRYRILIADRLPDASILDKEAAEFGKK